MDKINVWGVIHPTHIPYFMIFPEGCITPVQLRYCAPYYTQRMLTEWPN